MRLAACAAVWFSVALFGCEASESPLGVSPARPSTPTSPEIDPTRVCPVTAPKIGDVCGTPNASCVYADTTIVCAGVRGVTGDLVFRWRT
jgi:hypothetical protein